MAERFHVRNERGLVPVLRCDRDSPVTAVTIERLGESGVSERIEAVIHPRKWVRIGDRLCVKTSVIDTEPQRTVFLGHEHHELSHSLVAGSITPASSIFAISQACTSRPRWPCRYGAWWMGFVPGANSIRCSVAVISPRWPDATCLRAL